MISAQHAFAPPRPLEGDKRSRWMAGFTQRVAVLHNNHSIPMSITSKNHNTDFST